MKEYFSDKKGVMLVSSIAIGILGIFLIVQIVLGIKTYGTIGEVDNPQNVITVTGTSDVSAAPDEATFSFTVTKDASTVAAAQSAADPIVSKAVAYLKSQGIADKDIQTNGYDANPTYQYAAVPCPLGAAIACPPGNQTISGYEVSQTVNVTVHDITKAGAILSGVGATGVSNISSLTLTISNEDALKDQARSQAIDQARTQAEELAKELHVHLGPITSYSESNGGYPQPIYMTSKAVGVDAVAPAAATIPTGQNKITSNVTISYELR